MWFIDAAFETGKAVFKYDGFTDFEAQVEDCLARSESDGVGRRVDQFCELGLGSRSAREPVPIRS